MPLCMVKKNGLSSGTSNASIASLLPNKLGAFMEDRNYIKYARTVTLLQSYP